MAYGLEPNNSISFAKPQYASVARVGLSVTFVFIASVILSSKILINKSIVRIPFKAVIKSEVMCRALHFTLNPLVPVYIVSQLFVYLPHIAIFVLYRYYVKGVTYQISYLTTTLMVNS